MWREIKLFENFAQYRFSNNLCILWLFKLSFSILTLNKLSFLMDCYFECAYKCARDGRMTNWFSWHELRIRRVEHRFVDWEGFSGSQLPTTAQADQPNRVIRLQPISRVFGWNKKYSGETLGKIANNVRKRCSGSNCPLFPNPSAQKYPKERLFPYFDAFFPS